MYAHWIHFVVCYLFEFEELPEMSKRMVSILATIMGINLDEQPDKGAGIFHGADT